MNGTPTPSILEYGDLVWRVTQAARERGVEGDDLTASLPVPARGNPPAEGDAPVVLTFLYRLVEEEDDWDAAEVSRPLAVVHLRLDGEVVAWEAFQPEEGEAPLGPRFAGLAVDMGPNERAAFVETYYRILTSPGGPLTAPWGAVGLTTLNDLRELFTAFVEAPLLPLYRRHAADFLALLKLTP